jgi:phosphotriesterase-related protein
MSVSRDGSTRRDWLRMAAVGVAAGASGAWRTPGPAAAESQAPGRTAPVRFPRGAVVRTLLRDVAPDALADGVTLFHEHLSINLAPAGAGRGTAAGAAATPPLPPVTDNVDLIGQLVEKAGAEGISCIVDGGHADMGRKLGDLRTIAGRTKVHIVASGGYYMYRTYPPDLAAKSDDEIARELAREAREGRFGAYGEIGENPNGGLMLEERKVFRAVGKAHVLTGLPIFTHNSYGTGPNVPADIGLQQLDILESVGVRPEHIAIGHSCCLDDPDVRIISEIAKRGAFVGFDRVTTVQQIMPDEKKVAMVVKFLEAGHADKLLLSADFTGQRTLEAGPGYGRTLTMFAPQLRKAGVDDATVRRILHDNPRRFLAFLPKNS